MIHLVKIVILPSNSATTVAILLLVNRSLLKLNNLQQLMQLDGLPYYGLSRAAGPGLRTSPGKQASAQTV